ncbi:hypothetical protein [Salimicrobium flavidum]|uniref:Uncharacterized protein n=1 Tax=Salimicrobium flavidum TaxID=570947 RepID=A0A1N7IWL5_9BACI|nr:hypothetical protein [Salimicrobium flavidum]SIS41470.1 hypothetical protein SAMN05421687_102367 [Salimicrobium flavidum]
MMDTMKWFLDVLRREGYMTIQEKDIALEAVLLEKEEIGMDVYPEEVEEALPDPLLFETFYYEEGENDYLGVITMNEAGTRKYIARIFKNGDVLHTWILEGGQKQ